MTPKIDISRRNSHLILFIPTEGWSFSMVEDYGNSLAFVVRYDSEPHAPSDGGENASIFMVPPAEFPDVDISSLPRRTAFWTRGYEAAKSGATPDDCPFKPGQYAFEEWMSGWASHDLRQEW